jgi:hypothetical protein
VERKCEWEEYGACIITIMNVPLSIRALCQNLLVAATYYKHGNNVTILIYLFVKM